MTEIWQPQKPKVSKLAGKSTEYPFAVENLMGRESGVGCTEAEYALDRIAGGASVVMEAERLGLSSGAFIAYFRRDEHRYDAYLGALADQAELDHQTYRDHANKMIDKAPFMESNELAAMDKGLKHLGETLKWNNSKRFEGNKVKEVNVQVNIQERLADIARARKEQIIEGTARVVDDA